MENNPEEAKGSPQDIEEEQEETMGTTETRDDSNDNTCRQSEASEQKLERENLNSDNEIDTGALSGEGSIAKIRKRSSNSFKRNYRKTLQNMSEDSNECESKGEGDGVGISNKCDELDLGGPSSPGGSKQTTSDSDKVNVVDKTSLDTDETSRTSFRTASSNGSRDEESGDIEPTDRLADDDLSDELAEFQWGRLYENLYGSNNEDELESSDSSDSALEDLDEDRADVRRREKHSSSSNLNSTEEGEEDTKFNKKKRKKSKIKSKIPRVLLKPKSNLHWNGPKQVLSRQLGYNSRIQPQSAEIFRSQYYGSLLSVERLELMKKLDGHNGCVNCLNFNYSGTKLASGSDDLRIKLWNYGTGQELADFHSGHRSNVFQVKFLPLIGTDNWIASCGRDGQVILTELDNTGAKVVGRRVAMHQAAAHKLAISAENPHVFMSCSEDSVVHNIDIRVEKPQRILTVRRRGDRVRLYSIHGNPMYNHEFCVSGSDELVRIYDSRKLTSINVGTDGAIDLQACQVSETYRHPPLKELCPVHLYDDAVRTTVTGAVYSYDGREILGTYNDDNVYLFDAKDGGDGEVGDCRKVFEGHRNSATFKGVNFFGDRSQFVVSGSDCGHIFLWDKETESIANFLRGDESGVINCLEAHPTTPILATSGLDSDVKVWIPSNEKRPKMGDLLKTVKKNLKKREKDREGPLMDGHVMMALYRHMRRANRRNGSDEDNMDEDFLFESDDSDYEAELARAEQSCSVV